jgi:hypothetical protein
MIPTRPNIGDFINLVNELADAKTDLATLEWELEKAKAHNIKTALTSDISNKSRAVDYAKIIGNTDTDEKYIDGLMNRVIKLKRDVSILYGKIQAWESAKDIYRSDSFHMIRGSLDEEHDE